MNLIIMALITGAGGSFTPCTLGVNLAVAHRFTKDTKARRIRNWIFFAVNRALLLTVLGLIIGALGQVVETFTWWFQMVINIIIIIMGLLFIVGSRKPVLPGVQLSGKKRLTEKMSPGAMGALFGLNITACVAPLVLALLAGTVTENNWILGGVSLFIFGIMLSMPILTAVLSDRASSWIIKVSGKYRKIYYGIVGITLIVLGISEIILSMYVIPLSTGAI